MGILTKHLLEAPVPPRKRRPDLEIMPDVEAICLKAMEKDRDKRFAGHGRALSRAGRRGRVRVRAVGGVRGAAGAEGEPQVSDAGGGQRRGARVADRDRVVVVAGTFEDERPVRLDDAAGGKRGSAKIALVVGGLALGVASGVVFALQAVREARRQPRSRPRRRSGADRGCRVHASPPARPRWPRRPRSRPRRAETPKPAAATTPRDASEPSPAQAEPDAPPAIAAPEETEEPKADPLHRDDPDAPPDRPPPS